MSKHARGGGELSLPRDHAPTRFLRNNRLKHKANARYLCQKPIGDSSHSDVWVELYRELHTD